MVNRCLTFIASAILGAAALGQPAAAAEYPEPGKTIDLIVPWAAGGPVDVVARLLAPELENELGTNVEVVNLPGAGSQVGMTQLAASKPDGYTIAIAGLPGLQTTYFDPARQAAFSNESFEKVTLIVVDPEVVVVRTDSPFQSVSDLAEAAREDPGSIRISVGGLMADSHLGGILLEKAIGADLALVTFDGGLAPALTATLGGHTHAFIGSPPSIVSTAKAGDVRIIGVMAEERNELLPDVPTLKEQGFEDTLMGPSRGIVAPAGTPAEVVAKLDAAIQNAMRSPEVQENLRNAWATIVIGGPDEFQAYWDEMDARTQELMKEINR